MGRGDASDMSVDGEADELPEHGATIGPVYLDRFEVTVGRFRAFVADYVVPSNDAGAHPSIPNSGWNGTWNNLLPTTNVALAGALDCSAEATWTDSEGQNESRPINCVTWYEAFAFCIWDGGRLPTEAEWEYAAAGGLENRLYPWGAVLPNATRAAYACQYDGTAGCSIVDVALVGGLPAGRGRYGHDDLAGNVWEWALDRYSSGFYTSPEGSSCNDCANLTDGANRILRGGSHDFASSYLRAVNRGDRDPAMRYDYAGMRCARTE